ncbi:MAG: hypothetical protein R2753_16995 [Chitinophagales bacterium]
MSREQFEEELRNRIKDYSPEVNTQQLWDSLQQKKPKNYLGIFALFFLLAGAGTGIFFLQQGKNQFADETNLIDIVNQDDIKIQDSRRKTQDAKLNAESFQEEKQFSNSSSNSNSSSSSNSNSNTVSNSNLISNSTKNASSNTTANTNSKINTRNSSTNNQAIKSTNSNLEKIASGIDNNNNKPSSFGSDKATADIAGLENNFSKSKTIGSTLKSIDNELIELNFIDGIVETVVNNQKNAVDANPSNTEANNLIRNGDHSVINSEDAMQSTGEESITTANYSEEESNTLEQKSSTEIEQLNNASIETFHLEERTAEAKISNWQKMDGEVEKRKPTSDKGQKYKSNRKTFELSIEVLGGPMFPFKSLTAKSEEDKAYLSQRQFTEQVLRGYTAEVNTYGEFKKMGYFKVGVSYAGFQESFIYKGETIREYYDPNGIQTVEINGDGDTTFVMDSVLVTQVIGRNINRVNAYSMMDLSVSMGYILSRSKWSIYVDGGIAYNLLFKANGQFLNRALEPINFSDELVDGGSPLKKNLGVAVVANMGFDYQINPHLKFKIQTGYKRYFSDFSTVENPIRQKYNFINLGLGLSYTFNNF